MIEGNHLLRNSTSILIRDNSRPTLRLNIISQNKSVGIVISDNCQGLLEENVISDNACTGVEIKSSSNPILRKIKFMIMQGMAFI